MSSAGDTAPRPPAQRGAGGPGRPGRASLRRRVGRVLGDLGRVSGGTLVDLLVGHLEVDLEAVGIARRLVTDGPDHASGANARSDTSESRCADVLEVMEEVEHRGDGFRSDLVDGLSKALVTTIDREDLFRLSRSIDDVLDNVRDFVREWTIYLPTCSSSLCGLLDRIAEAIRHLERAVVAMKGLPEEIVPEGLAAKKACNQVRREYEVQLGELFSGELDMEVLKMRELFRRLDVVGLRLDEAVDVLLDAAVKRGG